METSDKSVGVGLAGTRSGSPIFICGEFYLFVGDETHPLAWGALRIDLAEPDPHHQTLICRLTKFRSAAEHSGNRARLSHRRNASLRCKSAWRCPRVNSTAGRYSARAPEKPCGPAPLLRWTIDKFLPGR